MLAIHEQIHQTLKKSKRVLLTCKQDPNVDSLASCLSMFLFLKNHGIEADVVLPTPHQTHDRCLFLPGAKHVLHGLKTDKNTLVIHVAHPGTKVEKFHYDVTDGTLNIYITPAQGRLEPGAVQAEAGRPPYDLIVTCDTPDLASLGALYTEHADFFLHTPIINLDHNPANEQYGQINHVDITHVSTCELLFHLFEEVAEQHIDADVATTLLAGMISKTHSFRSPNVTPRSLMAASELVQRGGRRDEVIEHLYRQHELPVLRLWGRVLARLESDDEKKFMWSIVKHEDFERSKTKPEELPGLLEELIATTSHARFVALLYERPEGGVGGWLKTEAHSNAVELTKPWGGVGGRTLARFSTDLSASDLLQKLRAALPIIREE